MGLIGSLIGAVGNVAAGTAQGAYNLKAAQETNATNLQLAKDQNDWNLQQWNRQNEWNLEQWNRENEYNSPANQLRLLTEAGFNPNEYKQGTSTANSLTSESVQSADLANQQAPQLDIASGLRNGMDALVQYAQSEELRAQIAEAQQRMRFAESYFPHQLQALGLANEQALAQTGLIDQQTRNAWLDYRQAWRMMTPLYEYQHLLNEGQRKTNRNLDLVPSQVAQEIASSQQGITESQQRIQQAWRDLALKAHLQQWQIKQMQSEMANVNANTDLLMFRVRMAKKFHIDPNLPALNNLITLSLADPDQFSQVGQRLSQNFKSLFQGVGDSSRGLSGAWNRFVGQSWFNPGSFRGAGRSF